MTEELRALRELRATEPRLHGPADREPERWRLDFAVLEWIARAAGADDHTLETGCGYSTIVFAALGTRHTVVSPLAEEHERVRAWCREHGVGVETVEFLVRPSHEVLPSLDPGPLDLVLVDGSHAFPWPFLDWFYTAEHLRQGGLLVVDDTHLRTGAILRDFLMAESGRWTRVREFRRSVVFRKTAPRVLDGAWWGSQPWGARPLSGNARRIRRLWSALRGLGR